MTPITKLQPAVLTPEAIAALPEVPLGDIEGVTHRVLWRSETSMAGVMTIARGHHLGDHAHRVNHHHMWVLDGHANILGAELGPGSYVHIPSGTHHDIDASATEGCTVYYLYLPEGG
jgi:quercetin dioxygenase-like cupin family protein